MQSTIKLIKRKTKETTSKKPYYYKSESVHKNLTDKAVPLIAEKILMVNEMYALGERALRANTSTLDSDAVLSCYRKLNSINDVDEMILFMAFHGRMVTRYNYRNMENLLYFTDFKKKKTVLPSYACFTKVRQFTDIDYKYITDKFFNTRKLRDQLKHRLLQFQRFYTQIGHLNDYDLPRELIIERLMEHFRNEASKVKVITRKANALTNSF